MNDAHVAGLWLYSAHTMRDLSSWAACRLLYLRPAICMQPCAEVMLWPCYDATKLLLAGSTMVFAETLHNHVGF